MNTEKFSKALNKSKNNKKDKLKSNNVLKSNNNISSSEFLTPSAVSNYRFYSTDTTKSIKLPQNRFTNFLNENQISDYKTRILPFLNDLKQLSYTKNAQILSVYLNKDIREIFLRYIQQSDIDKFELDFKKYNILDAFELPTAYRIFFYKDIDRNEYVIFLIDPHHLVIPDKMTKEQNTYKKNENNNICISTFHQ
jgi:conserved hypothetical protein